MSLFSTNQKSLSLLNEELSTLSIAKKERLDIDAKKKLIDGKMEYLRNEYEKEIAKVTEIRNKSKNLYKLKKGIEGWKNQKQDHLKLVAQHNDSHKLQSSTNKKLHELKLSKLQAEILSTKRADFSQMKELRTTNEQKKKEMIMSHELSNREKKDKITTIHRIQQQKKEIMHMQHVEKKKNRFVTMKKEEEVKKNENLKYIQKMEEEEKELLEKFKKVQMFHKMSLEELGDLKEKNVKEYEEKYGKPIQMNVGE